MLINPFQKLADVALEQSLLALAKGERQSNADIILHLLVVKERKLYAPAGYDSLFSYSTGHLGFSRSTAYRRKAVVDKALEYPALVERLRDGRLHLCAAAKVAPHLELHSATELLDAVVSLSHREVEEFIIKRWQVKPTPAAIDTNGLVFGDYAPAGGHALQFEMDDASVTSALRDQGHRSQGSQPEIKAKKTVIKPVSAETSRLSVTLNDKTLDKFKRAKEILGAKTDDEILSRALDKLLEQIAPERRQERREMRKQKKVAVSQDARDTHAERTKKKSRPTDSATAKRTANTATPPDKPLPSSRRGRQADRDQVVVDTNGQCSFVSHDGTRCMARHFTEIDHVQPWAIGGLSTVENQRLLCRTHNAYFAEQTFGKENIRYSQQQRVRC